MRRNRSPKWTPMILFLLVWLGASVTPLSAQSSTDQVWKQLQDAFTTAYKDGFKQYNYMVGYLDHATSPSVYWPLVLAGGSSYLIVGVCDNNCGDFDLALEDVDRVVIASDTAPDAFPRVSIIPSTTVTYWVKPTMHECRVNPCGYGIGVFTK